MFYQNLSLLTKTFHGVTFKPGQIAEVNEYINDMQMIEVAKPKQTSSAKKQEEPKQEKDKASSAKGGKDGENNNK